MNHCGRDRRFVVYSLSIDGYVFYVGKTSIRLKDRWRSHVTENKRIIEIYKERAKEIIIEELEEYNSDKEALAGELFWMQMIKYYGFTIINKFHNSGRFIPLKHQRNCTQMLNFIK